MIGTIMLDVAEDGKIYAYATRHAKPTAAIRKEFYRSQFGDIHAFVSHYLEAVQDPSLKWETP